MKKLLLLVFSFVFFLAIAGCSGGNNAEKLKEDSIKQADSIAMVAAEQARLDSIRQDSIRQDSIAKAEEKASRLSILDFCQWNSSDKVMSPKSDDKVISKLKQLGFECRNTTKKKGDLCGEDITETWYTFVKDKNNLVTTISMHGIWETEIEFPNQEYVDDFISTALSNKFKKGHKEDGFTVYEGPNTDCYWDGTDIKVKGNKVILRYRIEC